LLLHLTTEFKLRAEQKMVLERTWVWPPKRSTW
jgi:hypothetical protein